MNPLQYLYDRCNRTDSQVKYNDLPDFPTHVDVELTSTCNFRCLMCPTGNRSLTRDAEFMTWEVFDRIVTQCEKHDTHVRLIGWGEPLSHPQIHRFIRRATEAGLMVHLNTNGSLVDDRMSTMLINGHLTSIKFSLQGVSAAGFQEMRQTEFYDDLHKVVRKFHIKRGKSPYPYMQVSTSVTNEGPEEIDAFRVQWEPFCDHLTVGTTIFDFMDLSKVRLPAKQVEMLIGLAALETTEKKHPSCPEVFDKLSIRADGGISLCCNDYNGTQHLGDYRGLKDAWNSQPIRIYREMLKDDRHDEMDLCKDCYDYMGNQA
jgi:MoaA/NifB/PqqE/SkfB family radical SAM enzyme